MTFDEWQEANPCWHEDTAGDCWNCDCDEKSWKQQNANYAPLLEVVGKLADLSMPHDADALEDLLCDLSDAYVDLEDALKAVKEKTNE